MRRNSGVIWLAGACLAAGCGAGEGGEAADAGRAEAAAAARQVDAAPPARRSARSMRVADLLGGADAAGFRLADRVAPFSFPRDHGPHPGFRTEWWYFTATLAAPDGAEYGAQFTLFRQGLRPGDPGGGWRAAQIYMGHLAVADAARGRHLHAERLARGHRRLAGVRTAPFAAWIEGWRLASIGASFLPARLVADAGEFALALTLRDGYAPTPQGEGGLSRKGPQSASYYYSIPRIAVSGTLRIGARVANVAGAGWLDREWSSGTLSAEQSGWNWFALQLRDGLSLMAFALRRRDGRRDAWDQGALIDARGSRALAAEDFALAPERWWRDAQGVRWPVRWRLTFAADGAAAALARETLIIEAAIDDQLMDGAVRYWEGLVRVFSADGRDLGRGYMEHTGYE